MAPEPSKKSAPLSIVLALLLVLAIAVTGYFVWQNRHSVDKPSSATDTSVKPQTDKQLYANASGKVYNVDALASTADQHGVVEAVRQNCISQLTAAKPQTDASKVVVTAQSEKFFNDHGYYMASGDYARLFAGCNTLPLTAAQIGIQDFLVAKTASSWKVVFAGAANVSCSVVDGKKVPAVIVSTCVDGTTTRAPKPVK